MQPSLLPIGSAELRESVQIDEELEEIIKQGWIPCFDWTDLLWEKGSKLLLNVQKPSSHLEPITIAIEDSRISTRYEAKNISSLDTDVVIALYKDINRNLSRCSTPIRDDALLEHSLELLVLSQNKTHLPILK